ncbi:hypothetical protein MSAN_00918600 [Mycena sanguinolenta]|uniref:Peptidase C14 caspase domain-containing protein n=1 Tax=Mycena sanguinolenta TaxID=230812 RepID=A0A8H6YUI8_9AGAR|nr:hypothetical protein MSAN_00918600 [Mycena sanguinolenta]
MSVKYQLREAEPSIEKNMSPRCPVFALVIGIDEYKSNSIPNLKGCVNDARAFKNFLTNRFNIPESQVAFLANQDATREDILGKFQAHLVDNPHIQKDDTIIVYYAGHGSRAPAPASWPATDGKIETLVPHDERQKDTKGQPIHGIPDHTINILLSRLASTKGNNITVIFDCCHSGGLSRGDSSGDRIIGWRFVETFEPIPGNLDENLFRDRAAGTVLPPDITHGFTDTHVLLAACRQLQRARECISAEGTPCGFFTNALIKQLRTMGPKKAITYTELVDRLPTLPDQHPQCEGANKDRFLFELRRPVRDRHAFEAAVDADGIMKVEAGSLHGIVVGTQFVLAQQAFEDKQRQLVFAAVSVCLDSSILRPITPVDDWVPLRHGTELIVSEWKNESALMKIILQKNDEHLLAPSDLAVERIRPGFIAVDSQDDADLAVQRTADDEFSLARIDPKLSAYAMPDVKLHLTIDRLPYVLDAVASFNFFLHKYNTRNPLNGLVKLELYKLSGRYGSRVPDMELGDLFAEGEARFPFDSSAKYGFAICNYSEYDLFPYLFYFDPASYTVAAWYLPEYKTIQAPLPAKPGADAEPTRITVGYGAGGGYAFQFVMPAGVTIDTGFLKLFVSTKFLDLRGIEQPAAAEALGAARLSGAQERVSVEADTWDALVAPITIYKKERNLAI